MKISNLPLRQKPLDKPKNEFGCEVIDDFLPPKYNKLRKRFGFGKILAVPHRNKDLMTGSGFPNKCHGNVRHMVEHIGGEQLLGFWIQDVSYVFSLPPKSVFAFYWHSVWITPEGKLVDLTVAKTELPGGKVPRRTFSAFIPFTKYKEGQWTEGRQTFAASTNYKKEGICLITQEEGQEIPNKKIVPFLALKKGKYISQTLKRSAEYLYKCGVFGGGFSQPSSVTGKYFPEIQKAA
jgi:hypothetical protein